MYWPVGARLDGLPFGRRIGKFFGFFGFGRVFLKLVHLGRKLSDRKSLQYLARLNKRKNKRSVSKKIRHAQRFWILDFEL
jgi:hypothetical protein